MRPTIEMFRKQLRHILFEATSQGRTNLIMKAGELHQKIGGYPGSNHRMPVCCNAMYEAMLEGDRVIAAPPKRKGASLAIEYRLPRPQ
jgi:5-methylcytosine-specific restriction protein A